MDSKLLDLKEYIELLPEEIEGSRISRLQIGWTDETQKGRFYYWEITNKPKTSKSRQVIRFNIYFPKKAQISSVKRSQSFDEFSETWESKMRFLESVKSFCRTIRNQGFDVLITERDSSYFTILINSQIVSQDEEVFKNTLIKDIVDKRNDQLADAYLYFIGIINYGEHQSEPSLYDQGREYKVGSKFSKKDLESVGLPPSLFVDTKTLRLSNPSSGKSVSRFIKKKETTKIKYKTKTLDVPVYWLSVNPSVYYDYDIYLRQADPTMKGSGERPKKFNTMFLKRAMSYPDFQNYLKRNKIECFVSENGRLVFRFKS